MPSSAVAACESPCPHRRLMSLNEPGRARLPRGRVRRCRARRVGPYAPWCRRRSAQSLRRAEGGASAGPHVGVQGAHDHQDLIHRAPRPFRPEPRRAKARTACPAMLPRHRSPRAWHRHRLRAALYGRRCRQAVDATCPALHHRRRTGRRTLLAAGTGFSLSGQALAGSGLPAQEVAGPKFTAHCRFAGPAGASAGAGGSLVPGGPSEGTVRLSRPFPRGFAGTFSQPPPLSPPGMPVPAAAPAPEPSRAYLVFDRARADVTHRARRSTGDAAQAGTRASTRRRGVNGFAGRSGTPSRNPRLPTRHAEAVGSGPVRHRARPGNGVIHG